MKIVKVIGTALIMAICQINSMKIRKEKDLPFPPTASDLTDHFGTEPSQNLYGPQAIPKLRLARTGVESGIDGVNPTHITPIRNFHQAINPNEVVAGDLDNTSFDASRIITPEIASKYFIFNYFSS
jgi:hypothetical protein